MTVDVEKERELDIKLDVLANDLAYWKELTSEGARFEKHHSQVARLARQLETAKAVIVNEAREAAKANDGARFRPLLSDALDLHRVWEFFRSKLAQRLAANYESYLESADGLAWDVYRAVVDTAGSARREPPLTFFSTEPAPFAMWRDRTYQFALGGAKPRRQETVEIVKSLPMPMIGMPWVQLGHIPDLLFLLHETGHEVEEELHLTHSIGAAVDAAVKDSVQRSAWLSWKGEVFGDVYATLSAGPEFTRHLISLVLTGSNVSSEARTTRDWGLYPTSALRVKLSIAVLKQMSFETAAGQIEAEWRQSVPAHPMQQFEVSIEPLVTALLDVPVEERKLRAFTPYCDADDAAAEGAAADLLAQRQPDVSTIRQAVAAAARAFRSDPMAYVAAGAHARVLERILDIRMPGVLHDFDAARQSIVSHEQEDQDAGELILKRLRNNRSQTEEQ